MFCHNNKAFLSACQKDAAAAALKKAALDPALGSSSTLKVAAPVGYGTLVLRICIYYYRIRDPKNVHTDPDLKG